MTLAQLPPVKSTKLAKNTKVVKVQHSARAAAHPPRPFRWTREKYHQLGKLNIFLNQRVELIEGEIVEMSPIGYLHIKGVALSVEAAEMAFGTGYFVLSQSPVVLNDFSEPEPDVAVYTGTVRDLSDTPTNPVLIIEVSDTTLSFDRSTKARAYARAGIADYWILNVQENVLEVYRNPLNGRYAPRTVYQRGQSVAPLAVPQSPISVDDLLP